MNIKHSMPVKKKKCAYRFLASTVLILCTLQSQGYGPGNNAIPALPDKEGWIDFVENKGQWETNIRYKALLPSGALFLTDSGFVYHFISEEDCSSLAEASCNHNTGMDRYHHLEQTMLRHHAYKVYFTGAAGSSTFNTGIKRNYYHNYFLGNDPEKWSGNTGVFGKIIQQQIYPGVDMAIYSRENKLKYDFIIAPGADPGKITLEFEGVHPEITQEGDLRIRTSVNEVIEERPYAYQEINGKAKQIPCIYVMDGNRLRFYFPEGYNSSYPLVIDPTLVFATYSGSTGRDKLAHATTYDKSGNLYAGAVEATVLGIGGWPVTTGAFQTASQGYKTVGINKYNASGSQLLYATYYGGNEMDEVNAMLVNDNDELIILGSTNSTNLPVTPGCFSNTLTTGTSTSLYLARFNSTGSVLLGATYIGNGGYYEARRVCLNPAAVSENDVYIPNSSELALDKDGHIWVAASTLSAAFPVTPNAFQSSLKGISDVVVFRMSQDCRTLMYSTYLGGASAESAFSIDINSKGEVVICGATKSTDFPTTSGVLHSTFRGGNVDGFVTIINPVNGQLIKSTFIGTDKLDAALRLRLDKDDNIYIMGQTFGSYPISSGTFNIPNGDVFIDKLTPDLSASLTAIRIGNAQNHSIHYKPAAFLIDLCDNVYVAGLGAGTDRLPLTPDAYDTAQKSFWFAILSSGFRNLEYASYFGSKGDDHAHDGVQRLDPEGILYYTICGNASNFPTTPGVVFPAKRNTGVDNFSFKFNFGKSKPTAGFGLAAGYYDTGCVPHPIQIANTSTRAASYTWDFGDGSPHATGQAPPIHTYTTPGTYTITLYAHNDTTCIKDDTAYMIVTVLNAPVPQISTDDYLVCTATDSLRIRVNIHSSGTNPYTIKWTPASGISGTDNTPEILVGPAVRNVYYVAVSDSLAHCRMSITARDTVYIDYAPRSLTLPHKDTATCKGQQIRILAQGTPGYTYRWSPGTGISDSTSLSPVITADESRIYTLTGSYPGCPDTSVMLQLDAQPSPIVSLGRDTTVCFGSVITLSGQVSPARTDYIYQWLPVIPQLQPVSETEAVLTADVTRWYRLQAQTPAGCTGTDSILVTVHPQHFGSAIPDTGFCLPDSIRLWAEGGMSYLWIPAEGLSSDTIAGPLARPERSTLYSVVITNESGCADTLHTTVTAYPQAIISGLPDTIHLYHGEQKQITHNSNGIYFLWTPATNLSDPSNPMPWVSSGSSSRYIVYATTADGCVTKDSLEVITHCGVMKFPNAFTPGSGTTFRPVYNGIINLRNLAVFNRWGECIFTTTDLRTGWDGTHNGTPQPTGVYIYIAEAESECGERLLKQGNVTLLR